MTDADSSALAGHSASPRVSIVIVTRNRCADILRALHSCIAQDYPNVEILVYDDASTDSTAVAIRSEFPHAQLVSMPVNTGYIVLRNRGFREANGEYVFSLDDDAYFTSLDTIARVVEQFEQHPQLAAIAMPYMEPGRLTQGVFVPPSDQPVCNVRTFVGCSHALRRNHVLDIDGYREFFVYGSEERDLCIRLLQRGYEIRTSNTKPLVHTVSPTRSNPTIVRYSTRNTILFDFLNVPQPYLLPVMLSDVIKLLCWEKGWRQKLARLRHIGEAIKLAIRNPRWRQPVSREVYRKYLSLPRHGPQPWNKSASQPLTQGRSSVHSA